jgi:hypothetical protein
MWKIRSLFITLSTLCFILSGCTNELKCERHFIPKGFIGEVKVYYDKKNGQKEYDSNGCIVYHISKDGKCLSFFPWKEGIADPNKTFKYFEIQDNNKVCEIQEFYHYYYDKDSLINRNKKYMYFLAGGYEMPNWVSEYAIDSGKNHKKYGY